MKVVLIRHGESIANFENYWTGWLDVPLTTKGENQAKAAGVKIKEANIHFDAVFTSVLQRAIVTSQLVLEASNQLWLPVVKTWRLNERHYGALIGKNKDEMIAIYGVEQVKKWRRGYFEVPPLELVGNFDRRYQNLAIQDLPKGESLNLTVKRVVPLWQDQIVPQLLKGKNILIAGHGNSLRALVKYLEAVPENEMETIKIPNAAPIVYEFDERLHIISKNML
ncbi:2,3-bisphosphoglycerate-dependent phosphoglycerate mutase [Enterococcus saigonensis]|uniref:2,3-bisphosphoglycerate-dependent phosphoglycerate mutase n=1 Tax=Enterococcus saigonensis TaxID=1805431 RepID=A0A679I7S9_9ENTE|nr:2,3-bisphosphoglycerate-dependent phosphoglycerate mutase [Enterococcus saigonensis]BCA85648.1 2,3-bisphosphoglycerate-dependent phosphoglycerate mutase [Enterococcus saigonensis]